MKLNKVLRKSSKLYRDVSSDGILLIFFDIKNYNKRIYMCSSKTFQYIFQWFAILTNEISKATFGMTPS